MSLVQPLKCGRVLVFFFFCNSKVIFWGNCDGISIFCLPFSGKINTEYIQQLIFNPQLQLYFNS